MSRRSKLLIVIVVGLLLLALGLWIFFQPYLKQAQNVPQPPELPSGVTPSLSGQAPTTSQTSSTPAVQIPTPTPEQMQLSILEHKASSAVERMGSGNSEGGFLGYADAMIGMTASAQKAAQTEQAALQKLYPSSGSHIGMTTRAVASRIRNGKIGDATLTATVDALQTLDAGDVAHPTSVKAKTVTIVFEKQSDDSYLIDRVTWEDRSL